jgi:hypothetical protein
MLDVGLGAVGHLHEPAHALVDNLLGSEGEVRGRKRAGRSGNGVTDQASLAELENNALVNLIELKERALPALELQRETLAALSSVETDTKIDVLAELVRHALPLALLALEYEVYVVCTQFFG